MNKSAKKMVSLLLCIVMIFTMTGAVNAASGYYGSGTYSTYLMITPSYATSSVTFEAESPSDYVATNLIGNLRYGAALTPMRAYGASGSASFFKSGYYDYAECDYYVDGSWVYYEEMWQA